MWSGEDACGPAAIVDAEDERHSGVWKHELSRTFTTGTPTCPITVDMIGERGDWALNSKGVGGAHGDSLALPFRFVQACRVASVVRSSRTPKRVDMSIPETIPRVIPRLFCRDPGNEIDFCRDVFDATVQNRRDDLSGKLVHALVGIGPALVMIESEWEQVSNRAPEMNGSTPVVLYVYVDDVDATARKATARGARTLSPAEDQPWGDRTAWLLDPQGHVWTVASRVEEMSEEERRRRILERQQGSS